MVRRWAVRAAEILAPKLVFWHRISKYASVEPEQQLVARLCDKEHVAIDIGANIGIYSGLMVKHARMCYAFEANPALARQLRRAQIPGLMVTNAAVSDRAGQLTLYVPRTHGLGTVEMSNSEFQREDIGPVEAISVPAIRLDDLEFDPVSLIKIDVEGHEEAVLNGSINTLEKHRPALIIESENRRNPGVVGRIFSLMSKVRYKGFFLRGGHLLPLNEFDEQRDQNPKTLQSLGVSHYTYNFIFVHTENEQDFLSRADLSR
jgi:FkbM family methyltransferase